jgi:proline dehydrogenase
VTAPDDLEFAADTLRAWALDEELKRRVMGDPALAAAAGRIARRYTAGDTIGEAVEAARAGLRRGHQAGIEYSGESVRDAARAISETGVFLRLIDAMRDAGLPGNVSFDLSHVGAVFDPDLALTHVRAMAAPGVPLMISAEGSDRTDLVLGLYDELAPDLPHLGVTVQARLHRTPADLTRVLRHRGRVRLVKGAFLESEDVAYRRGSGELTEAYLGLARRLIAAGHPTSLATHDEDLIEAMIAEHRDALRTGPVEFEMLLGLGTGLLDRLHAAGYRTREYVIFGGEWWLYVLNRIAESPERVLTALADLRRDASSSD